MKISQGEKTPTVTNKRQPTGIRLTNVIDKFLVESGDYGTADRYHVVLVSALDERVYPSTLVRLRRSDSYESVTAADVCWEDDRGHSSED